MRDLVPRGNVLLVIDDESIRDGLQRVLEPEGHRILAETDESAVLASLAATDPEINVVVVELEQPTRLGLCRLVSAQYPELPVVIVSGHPSAENAVAAVGTKAYGLLPKPLDAKRLLSTVSRAVRHRRIGSEVSRLRQALACHERLTEVIGTSTAMRHVLELVDREAVTEASVLVTGEPGTEKETVARSLHARGHRRNGPFVSLDCGALPSSMVRTELFGSRAQEGMVLHATGGTLFLDQIDQLPAAVQRELLRTLKEQRVRPLGGTHERPIDIRLVTATSRNLGAEVMTGRFRSDLLYGIDVVRVELPPLRARGRDVLLLAHAFIERHGINGQREILGLEREAAERLLGYAWPDNVRELESCIDHASTVARGDRIGVTDLPATILAHQDGALLRSRGMTKETPALGEQERRYMARLLEMTGGDVALAARILDVPSHALEGRIREAGLDPREVLSADGNADEDHDGDETMMLN